MSDCVDEPLSGAPYRPGARYVPAGGLVGDDDAVAARARAPCRDREHGGSQICDSGCVGAQVSTLVQPELVFYSQDLAEG